MLDAAHRRSEVRCVSHARVARCSVVSSLTFFPPLALSYVRTNVNSQDKVRGGGRKLTRTQASYLLCHSLSRSVCALQDGKTPLHNAVYEKKIDCIKALMAHPNIDLTRLTVADKVQRSALVSFPTVIHFVLFEREERHCVFFLSCVCASQWGRTPFATAMEEGGNVAEAFLSIDPVTVTSAKVTRLKRFVSYRLITRHAPSTGP